jgi:CBS domain-containing protein
MQISGNESGCMRRMGEIVRHCDPVMLPPSASVQDACRRMREASCGAVLVCDEANRLLGIFTGRDAVCRVLSEGRSAAKTRLGEVMTRDPITLRPDHLAIEALRMMQDRGFRHLPIVAADKIVGLAAHGDFRGLERARLEEETGLWERI